MGNNLIQSDVSRYLDRAVGYDAFILLKEVEDLSRFTATVLSNGRLIGLVEKPKEPSSRLTQ